MPHRWLNYRQLGALLGCLSHPARLRIVDVLAEQERDVNALTELLRLSQTSVSQHLAQLRHLHVVIERREGRHVVYRLSRPEWSEWLKEGLGILHQPLQWENPWEAAPWKPREVSVKKTTSRSKKKAVK